MKIRLLFFLSISLIACQPKNDKQNKSIKSDNEVITIHESQNSKIIESGIKSEEITIDSLHIFPKDTLIDKIHYKFKQLSEVTYFELLKNRIETPFENDYSFAFLKKKDSCYYLDLLTNETDTLCNFDDGEYYESYTYKGLSKKYNTVLFDWENWEEAHSILINLNQKKHWLLSPEYEVSPDKNKIVTYSNYIDYPIYEKNEFIICELTEDSIQTLYKYNNQKYGVFESKWVTANKIILHIKELNNENYTSGDSYYFELLMKNSASNFQEIQLSNKTVISISPDSLAIEKMKLEMGEESFYSAVDDINWYQSQMFNVLDSLKIDLIHTDKRLIKMISKNDSIEYEADTSAIKWRYFYFDGNMIEEKDIFEIIELRLN